MGMSENSSAKGVLWLLANEDVHCTLCSSLQCIDASSSDNHTLCLTVGTMRTRQCCAVRCITNNNKSSNSGRVVVIGGRRPPSSQQKWFISWRQVFSGSLGVIIVCTVPANTMVGDNQESEQLSRRIWAWTEQCTVVAETTLAKDLISQCSALQLQNSAMQGVMKCRFPAKEKFSTLMQSNYQYCCSNASLQVIVGSKVIGGSCG